MKKNLPSLTAFLLLCVSWSAAAGPAKAPPFASNFPKQLLQSIDNDDSSSKPSRPVRGSAVLVPPLISMNDNGPAQPARVLHLPVQAGKVSTMVATNLLAHGRSWIAKGNKYYSLCRPDSGKVACAPIVATATMKDIEIGAYADEKKEPKLIFRIDPATKREPKRLIAAVQYFLARVGKQVAHFDRIPGGLTPARAGNGGSRVVPNSIPEIGSGGCTYDDFGSYDCSGGTSGWDGGGHVADSYDWHSDYWGDEDSWEDPASSNFPSFPSGNDNGDADPCVDAGGNDVCQQVIITGQRPEPPEEMALSNCIVTPWAVACNRPPPPVFGGVEIEQLPKGPRPWLPQGACNFASVLCSAGQVPEVPPPPLTDAERLKARRDECLKEVDAEMAYCRAMRGKFHDPNNNCMRNAIEHMRDCERIGQDGY